MRLLNKMAPALAGFALAAATASMAADDPAIRADHLLAEAKAATGGAGWDRLKSLTERGSLAANGLEGTYENLIDLRHVLSIQKFVLGPATGSQGWDGKAAWSTDPSGQVRIEEGGEALASAIEQSYRSAYAFFWPARWPATRLYVGERHTDGVTYDAVKVTPKGSEPFELWFERTSHRIAREVEITGAQPHTQILSDYREVGGVRLPFQNRDTMGEAKFDTISTAAVLQAGGTLAAKRFAPPPPPKETDPFPVGRDQLTIPFKLANNHIYVQAAINGQAPQQFMFDTGASALLDTAHAMSLGVKAEGALPGGGFGQATSAMGLAKVRSVDLGGFKLSDQVFLTTDFSMAAKVEGLDAAGLLGYEIPKRTVMTIDYAKGEMTLTRPSAFKPPAGAVAVPFKFDEHIPMIEASIDGVSGEFEIDTGARSALTVMGPFAEANHLTERYHATRLATAGYGLGGPARELLARADEFKIGSIILKQPVTLIAGGTRGVGAAARTAGNIGGDLLRRFTLTLDYGHQVLYLQPNAAFDTADLFDRSGLWLMREPDGNVSIADVTAGSGGETAGFKAGDRIVAVDGTPSSDIPLSDLREKFKGAPGTTLTLRVMQDGGASHDVPLTLGDLI
ncbi:MAG TPA: aspartyl protease family protein [Aliidongia sp.]|uniref:aspartyl protease family protein n=1 Tax=Aliidongia sp. TaxID=1914230 RepID=UPI002DDD7C93|nr:aspartyl protease family protein [Aliidongia sp.]HEV2672955.1 aspartyl protease family protein [Aliidongia sp.]